MSANPIPNPPAQRFDRADSPINTFPVGYSLRAMEEQARIYEEQMLQNRLTQAALEALNRVKNLYLNSPSA